MNSAKLEIYKEVFSNIVNYFNSLLLVQHDTIDIDKNIVKEYCEIDYIENDPIVIKFKNDLKDKYIFANQITKIKPLISEKWIKEISSY